MSNTESNNKNQRKLVRDTRAIRASSVTLRTQAPPGFSLYQFVYRSTLCAAVAVFLIFSFLCQGVYVVYANEVASDAELVAIPIEEPEVPTSEPAQVADAPVAAEVTVEDSTVPSEINPTETQSQPTDTTLTEQPDTAVVKVESPQGAPTATSTDTENPPATNEPIIDTVPDDTSGAGTNNSSSDETSTSTEAVTESPDTTANELESATSTQAASSSELIGPAITEPVGVNYSDSGFTFSKNECTELASGSFYCLEPRVNVLEDALFAAPDKDGDLEIFLVRNGTQTQITDNFVDDAAPFFDQNSETIVWHRLVDDRYQIISYDLASGEETQLTKNGTNNMEPIRQGKYTVWQRWVANNWDIMLSDGVKETQISHASAHDIAPYIHGSLVVWNRYGSTGEKTIEMFDIASETYVTVDDPEGLSVTNPRMVLVYDQMHPNGDIVTKGYDMIARKFIQLDTLPRELPDEIPESEPTSETRALIQSKPTVKGDEIVTDTVTGGNGEPPLPGTSATSSDSLTLDLSLEIASTSTPVVDTPLTELSDFDLVITPLSTSTEIATESVQE